MDREKRLFDPPAYVKAVLPIYTSIPWHLLASPIVPVSVPKCKKREKTEYLTQ